MVYNNIMLRTQIYLPASQVKALKAVAAKENSSVSELVRGAVEYKLNGTKKKPKESVGKWLQRLAEDAKKRGVKGPKDLATNMDKYLYDKDFR